MSKLTHKNTRETLKNVATFLLQLTLNIFKTIHFSTERCAITSQINSTIYHSYLSCQPLAAPQNISPTRSDNPIHDPHRKQGHYRGITGFGI